MAAGSARYGGELCFFPALFPQGATLRRLVACFLAVLELVRLGKLRVRQDEAFTDIVCDSTAQKPLEPASDPVTLPS